MNKQVDYYQGLLESNGYINLSNVAEFLKNNNIADYEVIAEIFNKGMSEQNYYDLQEAINKIESGE